MELLDFLISLPQPLPVEFTEADTRANVIDPVLHALGWASGEIKREPYAGWSDAKGFIDYLLLVDQKPRMVIEAKKTGRSFGLPQVLTAQRATTFKKLQATASQDLKECLDQCLRYAQHTGALYACATNGSDWLVFKPMHPSRALPDAKVVVFHGVDQVIKRIDEFSDLLSPSGVEQGRTERGLLGRDIQVPTFSKRLGDAFPSRREPTVEEEDYSNILDQMLKHYVMELTDEADFEECYLPAKGNKATAGTLDALISGRIDALRGAPQQNALNFGADMISKPVIPSVASGRTVVLHGDVGVGKTSFLRHCELQLRKSGQLNEAVWARIDLLPFRDRTFDEKEVSSMLTLICRRIQDEVTKATEKMDGRYDPETWDHLRDIYNTEVRQLQKARFPGADDSDQAFMDEARKYVWQISKADPQEHLVRVIRWLTVNCKLPVILALDNSDQLGLSFQEFLFKLSETLQSSTSVVVILVLRTEALASHKIREHSVASVREQFMVQKAPLAQVLQRRFTKILNQLPYAYPGSANKAAQDRLSVLMETIGYEAEIGSDAFQLIEASGNGSLRDSLRSVSAIFRSSPAAMDRMVVQQHEKGKARLGFAQALRALMKEDLGSAHATRLIPNIFSVDSQVTVPYSLGIRELQQVRSKGGHSQYSVSALLNDLSIAGVDRTVAERTLTRLRVDRLVSVPHMLPQLFEDDVVNVTRLGEVLLDIVLSEKSYFSRVAFDTYIYDRHVYANMRSAWTSDAQELSKKFVAIGRLFVSLVVEDDAVLRRRLDMSLLEPIISSPLPGLLGRAEGEGVEAAFS